MPQFDTSFWIQMIVYAVSFASVFGGITQRIKTLEQKMDKHNNIVERITIAERDVKSAHRRLDDMHDEIREVFK